jgi:putative colanic acid biosynthesis acetyltransferase WcaF
MKPSIDIAANRQSPKYSLCELFARVAWALGAILFRLTPRPFHGLRCGILRLFGARVGRDVHIYPSARIFLPWQLEIGDQSAIGDGAIIYNVGAVAIGSRTTVSQYAHLCAGSHDYRDPAFSLLRMPITIGDEAWICADAFVGPGVCIGDRAIVAARAVAAKDVPSGMIVAGNPARVLKSRDSPVLESKSATSR